MCGILLSICKHQKINNDRFTDSLSYISHRGPDFSAHHMELVGEYDLRFGHTRLAMLDQTSCANQPMIFGNMIIIFNGEIFNYKEIKTELVGLGNSFHTNSDTEVFLVAYKEWGVSCFSKFDGFWSVVLFDHSKKVVTIARDRFGIKPLYYYYKNDVFICSSEIKSILKLSQTNVEIDLDYLFGNWVLEAENEFSNTLYKTISAFPNSHYKKIKISDRLSLGSFRRYWRPEPQFEIYNERQAIDLFSEIFEDSVKNRVMSDRPMGLTLSGGVDSTAVAIALRNTGNIENIKAYTVKFNGEDFDEFHIARNTAKRLNLDHQGVSIDFSKIDTEFRSFAYHQELPVTSFSQLMNWYVHKGMEKDGIKGVLNGQGGDEIFLGYERHRTQAISPKNIITLAKSLIESSNTTRHGAIQLLLFTIFYNLKQPRKLLQQYRAEKYLHKSFLEKRQYKYHSVANNNKELIINEAIGGQLARLLRYDDRTASAFGMEGRPVFLDHKLLEFSLSLPDDLHFKKGWSKYIVRKYLEQNGFTDLAWSRNKLGFQAPHKEITSYVDCEFKEMRKYLVHVIRKNVSYAKLRDLDYFKLYYMDTLLNEMSEFIDA
jgi:asparagine synthase (glutamine-hydrolysing)